MREEMVKPDKAAIISEKITITYQELNDFCNEFGNRLSDRGLILIKCGINVPTIMGYAAAMHSGTPVMLCEDKGSAADAGIIENYRPAYIWQRDGNMPSGYSVVFGRYGYVLLRANNRLKYNIHKELALLLSTSGSTGSGKFVRISCANIEDNTSAIIKSLGIKADDRAMVMLPISYTYGLSIVNTYLKAGAALLVTEYPVYHSGFWKFAGKHSCSAICGVPYTYEIIRRGGFLNAHLTSLRLATQAGGKLSEETEKYMLEMADRRYFDFAVMYGQTEATARMACHILNRNPGKLGSAGRAIPGGDIRIENGEIVYSGGNVTMGYAESWRDLAAGDERGGVLYTGDLGYMDPDGFIYITGRKSRISKINGYRISLDELEGLIKDELNVASACVERADGIHIVLETGNSERTDDDIECMRSYVTKKTGINGRLIKVSHVHVLPRGENGKILYGNIALPVG